MPDTTTCTRCAATHDAPCCYVCDCNAVAVCQQCDLEHCGECMAELGVCRECMRKVEHEQVELAEEQAVAAFELLGAMGW